MLYIVHLYFYLTLKVVSRFIADIIKLILLFFREIKTVFVLMMTCKPNADDVTSECDIIHLLANR